MGCAVSVEGVANAPPSGEGGVQKESGDNFNCPSNQKQNGSSDDQNRTPSQQQQQEGQQHPQSSQLRSAYMAQGSIQSGATNEEAGGNGNNNNNDLSNTMKPVLPLRGNVGDADDDDATSTTFGHAEDHINSDNTVPAVGAAHNIRKLTSISSPSHAQSHTPESATPSKKETNTGLGNVLEKGATPHERQEGSAAEVKKVETSTNNRSALFAGGDPLFASSLGQEQPSASAPLSMTEKDDGNVTLRAHETTSSPLPAASVLVGAAAPSAPSVLLGGEGVIDGNALLAGDDSDDESGEYEMPEEQGMAEPPPFSSSDGPADSGANGTVGGGGLVMVDMIMGGGGGGRGEGARSKSKGRSTNDDFDEDSSSDDGELAEPTDHGAVKVIEQAPDRGGGGFVMPGPSPTIVGVGGGGEAVTRDRYGIVMAVRNADEALYARAVASKHSEQLTNNLLEDFEREFASPPSTHKPTSSSPNASNVNGKANTHLNNAQTSDHRQDDALAPFKVEEPSPPPISQSPPTHSLKPQPPSQPPRQVPAPVRSTSANGVSSTNNNNSNNLPVSLTKEKTIVNEESSLVQQDDLKSEKSKKEKKKKSGTSKSPAKGPKKTKAAIISSSSSSEEDNSSSDDEDTPPPSDDSEDENKTAMSAAAKKAKGKAAAIALRRLREKKKKEKEEKKKNKER